ncbi:MAG: phosphohistidine phosphatase SixA [Thermostichus sp. DG_1_6_bins_120]
MVSEVERSDESHNAAEMKNSLEALSVDFIRHGIAEEPRADMEDAFRALTDEGRKRCRKIARRLKAMGWEWPIILTSPLLRARQTAELFAEEGLSKVVQVFEPLAPGGSLADLVRWQTQQDPLTALALVGHQPDLSLWVQGAIGLQSTRSHDHVQAITLKKAGLAQVRFLQGRIDYRQGSLVLLISPKVLLL